MADFGETCVLGQTVSLMYIPKSLNMTVHSLAILPHEQEHTRFKCCMRKSNSEEVVKSSEPDRALLHRNSYHELLELLNGLKAVSTSRRNGSLQSRRSLAPSQSAVLCKHALLLGSPNHLHPSICNLQPLFRFPKNQSTGSSTSQPYNSVFFPFLGAVLANPLES